MKSWTKNLIGFGAVAVLLAWMVHTILKEQTPGQLAEALLSANGWVLLLGVPLMALFICCEAKSTHIILRALGCPQPFRRCCYYSCAGFFFSTITPSATGGQPAQILAMSRDGVPTASGTLDMLLVTIGGYNTATMAYGIFALLTAGSFTERLGGQVGLLLGLGLAVFTVLDVAIFLLLFLPGPVRRLCQWGIGLAVRVCPSLDRAALEEKMEGHLREYRRGAELIRKAPVLLVKVVTLSVLQLTCSYAMPYVVFRAFGLTGFSLPEMLALQALCAIAVGYLPLPGSAGAAENVFLRGFLLVFGESLVAPAMILSRTMNCYLVLAVTGLILLLGRTLRRRKLASGTGAEPEGESKRTPPGVKAEARHRAVPVSE